MKHIEKIHILTSQLDRVVYGQHDLKRDILLCFLSGGHILIQGAPGLAKTLTISCFSRLVNLSFQRIQFTPDLLPSDILGARIYNPESHEYEIKKGPIFTHIILADEINRAPSKVQSGLLEAMQEKQVSIGDTTFKLPQPFMVLATQNPLEQEGVFALPEAQLDRFMMQTIVDYPNYQEELEVLKNHEKLGELPKEAIFTLKDLQEIQEEIQNIHIEENCMRYICDIVHATRDTKKYNDIAYGASPRASIALLKTAKALAYLEQRDFVLPDDIQAVCRPVLRHRIILTYHALAKNIHSDDCITSIIMNTKIH